MKKVIAIVLSIVLCTALIYGCSDTNNKTSSNEANTAQNIKVTSDNTKILMSQIVVDNNDKKEPLNKKAATYIAEQLIEYDNSKIQYIDTETVKDKIRIHITTKNKKSFNITLNAQGRLENIKEV